MADSPDVFAALGNPVRRRVLELLTDGPRTAGALAEAFELSRPAVSEHLQVLREAGLVRAEAVGRQREYHLTPQPLHEVADWLHPFERYWRDRLAALAELLTEDER
jgi:DNA-binding transcriptional ArsR family regulator